MADSMAGDRFLMLVLLAFAAAALILALVGVYGVTAQSARRRMPEFGIRMAMGARAGDILALPQEVDAALRPFFAHVAAMMMINRR